MDLFANKKWIIIAGFAGLVIALGYLIFSFFFRPLVSPPPPADAPGEAGTGRLPIATTGPAQVIGPGETSGLPAGAEMPETAAAPVAQGGLTQTSALAPAAALSATLAGNGSDLQYYDRGDGKFYRVDKDGSVTALTDEIFYNVENVVWSPEKNRAILEYPDGANIVYDFTTGRRVTLPKHWEDFDFSPDGNSIVTKSLGLDPDNRFLAVANADGSQARPIESLGDNEANVYPAWSPNNQTIATFSAGIDFDRQEVYFIGLNQENFKSMVVEGRGFQSRWSPAGDRLLYSVYSSENDLKPELWVVNAQGENIGSGRRRLNLETWAEKCVFADAATAYCAVPERLEPGAGLFPDTAQAVSDRLYRIDTQTGLKKLMAIPDGDYSMTNLIVSANGYYLYFTDANSQRLSKIKLK